MTLGQMVKKARNNKGYTVRQLAEMCGVSPSYITKIEKDERKEPSYKVLIKLSNVLNLGVENSENEELGIDLYTLFNNEDHVMVGLKLEEKEEERRKKVVEEMAEKMKELEELLIYLKINKCYNIDYSVKISKLVRDIIK